MALVDKLDKSIYDISTRDAQEGLYISIRMKRSAIELSTNLIDPAITEFAFEILLPIKYPFVDPQILCLSNFAHSFLSLDDGRDIFNEVVGD